MDLPRLIVTLRNDQTPGYDSEKEKKKKRYRQSYNSNPALMWTVSFASNISFVENGREKKNL